MNAHSSIRIILAAATLLFATQLFASQRVLIRFDESGHHLHRIVPMAAEKFVPQSDTKAAVLTVDKQPPRYAMHIRWYDSAGNLLASDYQADPRVSHTPSQNRNAKPTFVRLLDGAYVVTGPAPSTLIEINLPDRFDVGLAAETWQVYLLQ